MQDSAARTARAKREMRVTGCLLVRNMRARSGGACAMVAKGGRLRQPGSAIGPLQALLPVVAVDDAVALAALPFAGGGFLRVGAAATRQAQGGQQDR